jgi:hypothetical protein
MRKGDVGLKIVLFRNCSWVANSVYITNLILKKNNVKTLTWS